MKTAIWIRANDEGTNGDFSRINTSSSSVTACTITFKIDRIKVKPYNCDYTQWKMYLKSKVWCNEIRQMQNAGNLDALVSFIHMSPILVYFLPSSSWSLYALSFYLTVPSIAGSFPLLFFCLLFFWNIPLLDITFSFLCYRFVLNLVLYLTIRFLYSTSFLFDDYFHFSSLYFLFYTSFNTHAPAFYDLLVLILCIYSFPLYSFSLQYVP